MLLTLSRCDGVLRNCAFHRAYELTVLPEKAIVPYGRQSYTGNCLKQVSTLERCMQWLPGAAVGSLPYLQNQMYWIGSGRCHTLMEHSRYCSVNEQASACRGRASSYSWGRSVSGQRLWRTSSNAQKLDAGLDSHTYTSQWFTKVQCSLPRQHARTARPPTANGGHVAEQGLLRGGLRRKLSPVTS